MGIRTTIEPTSLMASHISSIKTNNCIISDIDVNKNIIVVCGPTTFNNYPNGEILFYSLKDNILEYKNKLSFDYDVRYMSINESHMVYTTHDNRVFLLSYSIPSLT